MFTYSLMFTYSEDAKEEVTNNKVEEDDKQAIGKLITSNRVVVQK